MKAMIKTQKPLQRDQNDITWYNICHHNSILIGGWTTHLKNMIVKLDTSSPNISGENVLKKTLKPPPSW